MTVGIGNYERQARAPRNVRARLLETARVEQSEGNVGRYVWASLRFVLGGIFLWAFFDKLLGLGYATPAERAWINGGSPTSGFLKFSEGWFAGFFQSLAGSVVVDVLFMAGLLLIGLALVVGVGVKIAGYSGALMMMLMWAAVIPGENNPILDDHVVYAIVLIGLALVNAGATWGLGHWWSNRALVQKHPILQ